MAQFNITITEELLHGLFLSNGRDEAFSKLLEEIFNQVLLAQSSEQIRAEPYERTEERTAYRNGYRNRELTTRVGTLTLRVPRHRNGQFSTELFTRYQRSEQALVLAMMEMVINGVSTRKVEIITEELCGKKFSKSTVSALCKKLDPIIEAFRTRPLKYHYPFLVVDAIYVKVRENGRIRSRGLLIAIGINEEGYREVIGFQLANSESESCWGEFFSSLKERGLKNVDLVTSDDHKGKKLQRTLLAIIKEKPQIRNYATPPKGLTVDVGIFKIEPELFVKRIHEGKEVISMIFKSKQLN
jgi:putative transposase